LNYLDYFIIAAAAIGFLLGYKDGLIRKIIGLIGLIVGVALAFEFSEYFGKVLTPFFNNDEYLSNVISGILIFLVTILIASILKRVVHPLDKLNKFLNQFIGGFIGVIQIIFFISCLFLIVNIFNVPGKNDGENSLMYTTVKNLLPDTIDLIIGHRAKASDFIRTVIDNKDKIDLPDIDTLNIIEK